MNLQSTLQSQTNHNHHNNNSKNECASYIQSFIDFNPNKVMIDQSTTSKPKVLKYSYIIIEHTLKRCLYLKKIRQKNRKGLKRNNQRNKHKELIAQLERKAALLKQKKKSLEMNSQNNHSQIMKEYLRKTTPQRFGHLKDLLYNDKITSDDGLLKNINKFKLQNTINNNLQQSLKDNYDINNEEIDQSSIAKDDLTSQYLHHVKELFGSYTLFTQAKSNLNKKS